jgi:hypothetical protein
MEKRDLIITSVLIIVIGLGIWYEFPKIDVKIEIINIEPTDTSQVIYVTRNLIHEAEVGLNLSAALNGIDSPEYRSAKINYDQALSQLDELYTLYPFSVSCILDITNNAKTRISLRDIQVIGNLGNHSLMFKDSNYDTNSFKPGETITCIVTISSTDKESSIALYDMESIEGDLSISSRFKARLNTKKILDTKQISYNIPII